MQSGWKTPLVWKSLLGLAGTALFVVFAFHQPWIPVEITPAETGVLVALAAESRAIVEPTSPTDVDLKPIAVPISESPNEAEHKRTAEVAPAISATLSDVPEQDPSDLHEKSNAWRLGKPTVAYQLPEPFLVPASETPRQWNFVIPTGVQRDLYLTGAELRPGNRSLVKRMILSYDPTGAARKKDEETPLPGFASGETADRPSQTILGEWSPGRTRVPTPDGTGYRIPAGADLVLTVDYAATPVSAPDPWSMGLYFARSEPNQLLGRFDVYVPKPPEMRSTAGLAGRRREQFRQMAVYKLPTDATLYSIDPKVPAEGIGIRAFAGMPSGENIPLIHIEDWKSASENVTLFSEPIDLPKGSTIVVETWASHPDDRFDDPPASLCVFEVATKEKEHLEPLLRHNRSANLHHDGLFVPSSLGGEG